MPWCGRAPVVVRLVFGQDGAQMPLAEDQHPVQDLSAPAQIDPGFVMGPDAFLAVTP